jgi:hypothetical protein
MRARAFRRGATVGSLAMMVVVALAIPVVATPGAGAQEPPVTGTAPDPGAPGIPVQPPDDGGEVTSKLDPAVVGQGKEGRVLSLALANLAAASADAAASGDPVGATDAEVDGQLAALDLPAEGAGSMLVRADGRLVVNVSLASVDDATVGAIEAAGATVTVVSAEYRAVTAEVPVAALEALAAVPGVLAVTEEVTPITSSNQSSAQAEPTSDAPVTNAVNCMTNPTGIKSEGDTQLLAATARTNSAVDGTGVKVGVLSDTFNRVGSPSVTTDTTNAELPGPTNPCGHTTAVQVLDPGPGSGSDEGRAMVQIVHDLAPGSPLAFSSAFNSQLDFADEIRALQAAGSKVIVDDVSYFTEPFYQDGPVAKAVNDVTAAGSTYFSSAGNSTPEFVPTGGSYEALAFRAMSCPATVLAVDNYNNCHDYNAGGGTDNNNLMTIPNGAVLRTTLGWSEPMFGVGTDLDFFLLDGSSGAVITASLGVNANTATPVEFLGWQNTTGASRQVSLVVARYAPTGTGTPRLKTIVHRNPATTVEWNGSSVAGTDVAGPTVFGHNAALAGGSIAAIPYNNANTVEAFSSRGPAVYCWQPVNGSSPSPAMACQTKNLDVAATDGVSNSFFGGSGPPFRFYGTSASAPHAAAIAALQTQKQPCRTPAQYLAAQRSSAATFGSFTVKDYGSGRVTATTAITGLTVCNPPVAAGYHPLTPSRILDSRTPNGGWNAKLVAGAPRNLQVTDRAPSNIPSNASAVVMNVTVTDSTDGSFLKIWPTGTLSPNVSNLNFNAGQTIPNLVTVRLGTGGKVDIATAVGSTNVVADVVGYVDNGTGPGDRFTGIAPVRLLDSRGTNGGWNSQPLPAGTTRDLTVRPTGAVPAGATGIIANVTVVGATNQSFLRVWPSGEAEPGVSNLNFLPGQIIPNLVMVKIGTNGKISFSNNTGSTHVVLDVVGYYGATGSKFFAIDPTRVLDSRVPTGLNGKWNPGQTRDLTLAGAPGTNVPDAADGVIANFTVTDGNAQSLITVYPSGTPLPTSSNLNFVAGEIIPNLVAVRIPANNKISIYNDQGTVNVIADVVGYFAPAP